MIELINLANFLGISLGGLYVLIVMYFAVVWYLQKMIKVEKKRFNFITIAFGVFVLLLIMSGAFSRGFELGGSSDSSSISDLKWRENYIFQAESQLPTYKDDTLNTNYYDYDHPLIEQVSTDIALQSGSAREAITNTLDFVYQEVQYVFGEADSKCLDGVAPEILQSGKGQCDTQSIVVISILRKMGIAARPIGGCIVVNPSCRLQAFLQSTQLFRTPKFTDLSDVELMESDDVFSRGVSGFPREGGLHAYVIAWTPEDGWLALEPTSGALADTDCYYYHVELFPSNVQKKDICVSEDFNYAKACQLDDLTLLNQFGEGLVGEVQP